MGSASIAAWIAHVTFWLLLVYGWFWDELGWRGILTFLALWLSGLVGLQFAPLGTALFPSFVAILDVVLVFLIFKGDLRLT
jgi:hypothetical protein